MVRGQGKTLGVGPALQVGGGRGSLDSWALSLTAVYPSRLIADVPWAMALVLALPVGARAPAVLLCSAPARPSRQLLISTGSRMGGSCQGRIGPS